MSQQFSHPLTLMAVTENSKRVEVGVDGEKLQLFFKSALFIMATRWWLAVLTTVVRKLLGKSAPF